jgi:hypothetical protein
MYPAGVKWRMDRDVLGWFGALLGTTILAPILLYLITGAAVGFLVNCGGEAEAAMVVGASGQESLELSCSAVRTLVKTAVAVGGGAAATVGVAMFAVADMLRSTYR